VPLSIPDHIVWQNVEGELALFDRRDDSYHALNGSAATIWRLVAEGMSPLAIVDALAAGYAAPRATIAQGVDSFIADAVQKGLLATG
jgi:hypothetical protein